MSFSMARLWRGFCGEPNPLAQLSVWSIWFASFSKLCYHRFPLLILLTERASFRVKLLQDFFEYLYFRLPQDLFSMGIPPSRFRHSCPRTRREAARTSETQPLHSIRAWPALRSNAHPNRTIDPITEFLTE